MGLRRAEEDDSPPLAQDVFAPRGPKPLRKDKDPDILVYTSQAPGMHACIQEAAARLGLSQNKFCLRVLREALVHMGYEDDLETAKREQLDRRLREDY